jgi:hypothetical protein
MASVNPYFGPIGRADVTVDENFLERLGYYIGKPEEWVTKAIGQMVSDNPRYNIFSEDYTQDSFWHQEGFGSLLSRETVLGGGAAAGVGLLLSIFNPLDPLNYVGVGQLTKSGKIANTLGDLSKAGRLVKVNGAFVNKIDDILALARAESKAGGITKATKRALTEARLLRKDLRLAQLPKDQGGLGLNIGRILESQSDGLSSFERGHRSLLSLSIDENPVARMVRNRLTKPGSKNRAVEPFGIKMPGTNITIRTPQRSAMRSRALRDPYTLKILPEAASGRIYKASFRLGRSIKDMLGRGIRTIYPGSAVAVTEQQKQVIKILKGIEHNLSGKAGEATTEFKGHIERAYARMVEEGMDEDAIQAVLADVRQKLETLVDKPNQIDKLRLFITEAELLEQTGAIVDDFDGMVFGAAPYEATRNIKSWLEPPATPSPNIAQKASDIAEQSTDVLGAATHGVTSTGDNVRITDNLIVLEAGQISRQHIRDLRKLNIPGIPRWRDVPITKQARERGKFTTSEKVLAAEWNRGVQSPGTAQKWHDVHQRNLETTAAMLAREGMAFTSLDPTDFMVGADGTITLVNPRKLVSVKKKKDAVSMSREALLDLNDKVADLNRYDFPFLSSPSSARGLASRGIGRKNAWEFTTWTKPSKKDPVWGNVWRVPASTMVARANNTRWIFDLEAEDYIANGVAAAKQAIEETNTLAPIVYQVDPITGAVEVVEGSDRLAAAHIIAKETGEEVAIPVQREPWLGFVDEGSADNYVIKDPAVIEAQDLKQVLDTPAAEHGDLPFSEKTFLITDNGTPLTYSREDIRVAGSGIDIHGMAREFFTGRAAPKIEGATAAERASALASMKAVWSKITKALGPDPLAKKVRITKLIEQADDFQQFILLLKQDTGIDFSSAIMLAGRNDPNYLTKLDAAFRATLLKSGRDLGAKWRAMGLGFDTPMSTRAMGAGAHPIGQTLLQVRDDGVIVARSFARDMEATKKTVADMLQNYGNNLNPKTRVTIQVGDNIEELRVADLRGGTNVVTEAVKPTTKRFHVHSRARQALKSDGILISPTAQEAAEVFGDSFGEITKSNKSAFTFTRGEEPELIIAADGRSVEQLWDNVFGEGSVPVYEYGVSGPTGIYLSEIMGSRITTITKPALKAFEKRLHQLALKFQQAGYADEMLVHFIDTFPIRKDAVVDLLKKESWTLQDIVDVQGRVFKQEIPVHLANTPAKLAPQPHGPGSLVLRSEQIQDPIVRDLFETVQNTYDEAILAELQAGLPTRYIEGYFARILNPNLREKLNSTFQAFLKKKNLLDAGNKHMKGRVFSELTTDQVNSLFENLKTGTGKPIGLEAFYDFAVDFDSQFMKALALEAPEVMSFFITDPLRSAHARKLASLKSVSMANLAEQMQAFSMDGRAWTYAELQEKVGARNKYLAMMKEVQDLRDQRAKLLNNIAGLTDTEKAQFTAQIDSLENTITKKQIEAEELAQTNAFHQTNFVEWNDIGAKAWVSSSEAKRMLHEGIIGVDQIHGHGTSGMVYLDMKLVKQTDTKFMIFSDDVGQILEEYLGNTHQPGPMLKMVDDTINWWKQWTLFPIPQYHMRNMISNAMLAYMGGVRDARSFRDSFKIQRALRNLSKGKVTMDEFRKELRELVIYTEIGGVTNLEKVYDDFVKHGGLTGGLHYNEAAVFSDELAQLMRSKGMIPSSELISADWIFSTNNKFVRGGRSIAATIENNFRLGAFIDGIKKGMTSEDAALHMKKMFYDYSELNAFERNVMRRIFPFYSWMRHNIPRMITTMFTQPDKHYRIMQAMKNIQLGAGGPAEPEQIPAWLREKWHIVTERTEDGRLGLMTAEGIVPMVDAYRLMFSQKEGFSNAFTPVVEAFDMATESLTPILKVPVENILNKSFYSGRPIERLEGEPARSKLLSSIGASRRMTPQGVSGVLNLINNEEVVGNIRVLKMATRLIDDLIIGGQNIRGELDPTASMILTDYLIGRTYTIDPDRAMMYEQINNRALVNQAKAFIKRGRSEGREDYIKFGHARLLHLTVVGE